MNWIEQLDANDQRRIREKQKAREIILKAEQRGDATKETARRMITAITNDIADMYRELMKS